MRTKNILLLCYILTVLLSCDFKNQNHERNFSKTELKPPNYIPNVYTTNEIFGTWVSNGVSHFQIVEIIDSSKANIYKFHRWQANDNNIKQKLYYFKSNGKLSITYGCNIGIETDRFKFYYFLAHDTLFEMAEPGRVDTLVKVYSDSTIEKR
jgi:hypothetical protein